MVRHLKRRERSQQRHSFHSPLQIGASFSPHYSFADAMFRCASLAEDTLCVVFSYFLMGLPVLHIQVSTHSLKNTKVDKQFPPDKV